MLFIKTIKLLVSGLFFVIFISCGDSNFLDHFSWQSQTPSKESTRNNPIQTDIYLLQSQESVYGKYVQVTGVVTAVLQNSGFYIEGMGQKISGIWIDNYLPIWPTVGDVIEVIGLVNLEDNSLNIISRKIRYVSKGVEDRIIIEPATVDQGLEHFKGALVTFDATVTEDNGKVFLRSNSFEQKVLLGQRFFQNFPYLKDTLYRFVAVLDMNKDFFIAYPRSEEEVILLDKTPGLPQDVAVENIVLRRLKQDPISFEDNFIQFYSYVTAVGEDGFYVQDSSLCYDAAWIKDSINDKLSRGDHVLITAKYSQGVIESFSSQKVLSTKRFYSGLNIFVCKTDKDIYCPYFDGTLSQIEGTILEEQNSGLFVLQDDRGYQITLEKNISPHSFCPGARYKILGFIRCGSYLGFDPRSKADIQKLSPDIQC